VGALPIAVPEPQDMNVLLGASALVPWRADESAIKHLSQFRCIEEADVPATRANTLEEPRRELVESDHSSNRSRPDCFESAGNHVEKQARGKSGGTVKAVFFDPDPRGRECGNKLEVTLRLVRIRVSAGASLTRPPAVWPRSLCMWSPSSGGTRSFPRAKPGSSCSNFGVLEETTCFRPIGHWPFPLPAPPQIQGCLSHHGNRLAVHALGTVGVPGNNGSLPFGRHHARERGTVTTPKSRSSPYNKVGSRASGQGALSQSRLPWEEALQRACSTRSGGCRPRMELRSAGSPEGQRLRRG